MSLIRAPFDQTTHPIDSQFTWGDGLLISPVLAQGATNVNAYLPPATLYDKQAVWYNLYTGLQQGCGWVTLNAPLNTIPVHVRGGVIIPMQVPNVTTYLSYANKQFRNKQCIFNSCLISIRELLRLGRASVKIENFVDVLYKICGNFLILWPQFPLTKLFLNMAG